MSFSSNKFKHKLPSASEALPGRDTPMIVEGKHLVSDLPLVPPWPLGCEQAVFGMGCFWGAERLFWRQQGVNVTVAGYSGGITKNPTYEEVCTGGTGHAEVVRVVYDPLKISYSMLLSLFWENHDPTQGMRQGYDNGTQYRSAIYCFDSDQLHEAQESMARYQGALRDSERGDITTEIELINEFYYAESMHQQYLARNPAGYCGLRGTGVSCS